MKTKSIIAYLAVILPVVMCFGCASVTPQMTNSNNTDRTGVTGIVVNKGSDYPIVTYLLPHGPAVTEGRICPKDRIVSISREGKETGYVSTKGMSANQVYDLLNGRPDTLVSLRVAFQCEGVGEMMMTVRLFRASLLPLKEPGTEMEHVFAGPVCVPSQEVEPLERLRFVSPIEWFKVEEGISAEELLRILGEPARIYRDPVSGMARWDYRSSFKGNQYSGYVRNYYLATVGRGKLLEKSEWSEMRPARALGMIPQGVQD